MPSPPRTPRRRRAGDATPARSAGGGRSWTPTSPRGRTPRRAWGRRWRSTAHTARELGRLKDATRSQQEKGAHARDQVRVYSDLMSARIRMQKALAAAHRLPRPPALRAFLRGGLPDADAAQVSRLEEALKEARQATRALAGDLFDLHDALVEASPAFFYTEQARKRQRLPDAPRASGAAEQRWKELDGYYGATKPFVDQTIEQWGLKAKVYENAATRKFKVLDQTPLDQIKAALRDEATLIRKSQVNRLKLRPLGSPAGPEGDGSGEALDPELYDDSDLYGQLLGEVIAQGNGSGDAVHDLAKQMQEKRELQKRQNLARLLAESQASKGRKLRFDAHDKLINFMAPRPFVLPPHAASLFQSLFGGTPAG